VQAHLVHLASHDGDHDGNWVQASSIPVQFSTRFHALHYTAFSTSSPINRTIVMARVLCLDRGVMLPVCGLSTPARALPSWPGSSPESRALLQFTFALSVLRCVMGLFESHAQAHSHHCITLCWNLAVLSSMFVSCQFNCDCRRLVADSGDKCFDLPFVLWRWRLF
jgi:hypothetical protein